MIKQAYDLGVKLAIAEAVKLADDETPHAWAATLPYVGPLAAIFAAPEGKRLAGFGGTLAGSLGGGLIGSHAGDLVSMLSKGRVSPNAARALGVLGGMLLGQNIGYRKALEA